MGVLGFPKSSFGKGSSGFGVFSGAGSGFSSVFELENLGRLIDRLDNLNGDGDAISFL